MALIYRLQAIAFACKPYIPLCYVDSFSAVQARWTGLQLTARGDFPLSSGEWRTPLRRRQAGCASTKHDDIDSSSLDNSKTPTRRI